jgi:acyl-CoA thioester hydrolase
MNNSIYYHLFDSIVNEYLINVCGLDPQHKDEEGKEGVIGLVVESYCQVWIPLFIDFPSHSAFHVNSVDDWLVFHQFFAPISFPQPLILALRVEKLGKSSVRYEVGVFPKSKPEPNTRSIPTSNRARNPYENDSITPVAAVGGYTHVFVHPVTRRPVTLKEDGRMRRGLQALLRDMSDGAGDGERKRAKLWRRCCTKL